VVNAGKGGELAAKHRDHAAGGYVQWLYVGAVAVGLGAGITTGQGVAAAAPSDDPDTAQSASSATEATGTESDAASTAKDVGAESPGGSASGSAVSGSSVHQPVSKVSAQQSISATKDSDSAADPADDPAYEENAQTGLTADTTTATTFVTDTTNDVRIAAPTPGSSSTGTAKDADASDRSDTFATNKTVHVPEKPDHSQVSAAQANPSEQTSSTAVGASTKVPSAPVVTPDPSASHETAPLATTPVALSSVSTLSTSAITSAPVASATPVGATKVTLASIVTDVLTWIGLGPLATHVPVPASPVGPLFESLWLVVRDIHDRLTNDRHPVAQQIVAAAPTPDPLELADLLAHPDVAVNLNTDGSVDVIDGTFTDMTVTTDVEAAQLFNRLAPLLGASAGFARPENITVQQIGQNSTTGDVSETVYRVRESISGIPVLGSEAILVTDGKGAVTGLFNNLDRLDSVDVTLDARVDQYFEADAFAAAAYLTSAAALSSGWTTLALLASSRFDPELVVYALDPNAPPRLAWRVTVDPPQRFLAPPDPSATYYIYANGADAGTVMMSISGAQGLSAISTTATDVLGQPRTFNAVQETYFFFFQVASLVDLYRNLATYQTAFQWFGFGGPYVPSDPATRGWFGWNPSAVSGQANMEAVYDYYNTVLGRPSFDGAGGLVKVVVEYNTASPWFSGTYNNAYWDPGDRLLVFGDGGDLEGAVDVVAHEYTHAVVSYAVGQGASLGLDHGESGALNEAYADILGSLVEGKSGPDRWLIGEDSHWATGALRNIADPSSIMSDFGPYRETYATRYTGTGDDGGEHVNSTIFSHAAYLMMTDPATSAISQETWARVFYHSIFRLSPGATFVDGRAAVVGAARQLGFTTAQLGAIERAFDLVGIPKPAVVMV
jgi:Zn-dependent metalloprotease